MKKHVRFVAGMAMVAATFVPATALANTTSTGAGTGMEAQVSMTSTQMQSLEASAIKESGIPEVASQASVLQPAALPSPYKTSPLWSYSNLSPYDYITTSSSYDVTSTEQVYLTVKQYNNSDPELTYQLINVSGGSNSSAVTLTGLYESSYAYVYFNNVSPGTYVLRVYNPTSNQTLDGSGYTHYY